MTWKNTMINWLEKVKLKREHKRYAKLCDRVVNILLQFGEVKGSFNFKTMSNEFYVGNFMFWTNNITHCVFGGIAKNGQIFVIADYRDTEVLDDFLRDTETYMKDHKGLLIPDYERNDLED